MQVEVRYVQKHSDTVIFEIYPRCQAAIPIFDILIGFEVMNKRLNPCVGIFNVWGVFRPS